LRGCSQAFNDWCNTIDAEFVVKQITVQSVDMFGPRMGFVKFKGDITDEQGRVIPSIVFMRGASVGMLIVITCEEDKRQYTVLTVQPRVPTGKYALEELPAGMIDAAGSFVGAAAKELQEETGIIVKEKDLIDLTEKAFKGTAYNHVYPSAGGCDEILRLFLYQVKNQSDMS
jgi:ADP-sugar diphosphatase